MSLPLKELRLAAKFSQEELGRRLNLSQAQISRYEGEPGTAPFELAEGWCGACGSSIPMASRLAEQVNHHGIDVDTPYKALHQQLGLLEQYIDAAPSIPSGFPPVSITAQDLMLKVQQWKRKPTILIAGRFDSGKTRIANAILGGSELPSQYTPTTSVVTFVRHTSDRPAWQREEVWIMGRSFNPAKWTDQKHCEANKLVAGSFDTLRKFGTKESEGEAIGAKSALVYMDAPILKASTLIDLPGYSDECDEEKLADASARLADILIYTAPANGFIDAGDFLHLGLLLRALTPLHARSNGTFRMACNLFIVATHSDPSIVDEQLVKILNKGSQRLYKQLGDSVLARHDIFEPELRSRFFTFWYENQSRRKRLEEELQFTLSSAMPTAIKNRVDIELRDIKVKAKDHFAKNINAYQQTLAKIAEARENMAVLLAKRPEHRKRVAHMRANVNASIESSRATSLAFVGSKIAPSITAKVIESFIRNNFPNKNEAKQDALARLLELNQSTLESFLKIESEKLKPIVEEYLSEYEATLSKQGAAEFGGFEMPFDAQGAFVGGLAGLGTLGALGLWASAMGNLGGYILVAKLASVLSAVGLGVGSTAAVSFVAAIGGPVTLAIGLASLLALGFWALFGEDWETRLSKKIAKILQEKEFLEKTSTGVNKFWDQTLSAFRAGADEIERKFDEYVEANSQLLLDEEQNSREKIEATVQKMEELKDFFGGIPWRSPA